MCRGANGTGVRSGGAAGGAGGGGGGACIAGSENAGNAASGGGERDSASAQPPTPATKLEAIGLIVACVVCFLLGCALAFGGFLLLASISTPVVAAVAVGTTCLACSCGPAILMVAAILLPGGNMILTAGVVVLAAIADSETQPIGDRRSCCSLDVKPSD